MDSNNGSDDEFSDAVDDTMAPIKLECPIQDCTGGTDGAKWSCEAEPMVAVALLQVHGYSHQQTPAAAAPDTRKPRPRPGQKYDTDGAVQDRHSVTAYHIVSFYEQKSLSLNVTAKK